METKVVSLSEAERLSKMALQQTFERKDGVRVPIPYEAARSDGSECMLRAHVLAEALTELGYRVEKIFIQFLRTNQHGQKYGGFVNSDSAWWWHTACCIKVRTDSGTEEIRVLDPSGFASGDLDKPMLWTIKEWTEQHGKPASYEFITFEDFQRLMELQRQQYQNTPKNILDHYPANQTYIFTTERNYTSIPNLDIIKSRSKFTDIPNQYSNLTYNKEESDGGLERITKSTGWVPYCRISQDINKEMQEPTINNDKSAEDFLNAMTKKFGASMSEFHLVGSLSTRFSGLFSKSYTRFIAHLRAKKVSPAIIARFEEYLSGYYEGLENIPSTNLPVEKISI